MWFGAMVWCGVVASLPDGRQDIPREPLLYESRNAGPGAAGPQRDLFQQRPELAGLAGAAYEPYMRTAHHRAQHFTLEVKTSKPSNTDDVML